MELVWQRVAARDIGAWAQQWSHAPGSADCALRRSL